MTVRYSEIEAFWLNQPRAELLEIHAFTGEMTKRLCDCGLPLRRFETWNGKCEDCRRRQGQGFRDECGCYDADRNPLRQTQGWHVNGREVTTRCPRYWNGRRIEVEVTKKEGGRAVKKKAEIEFHLSEDGIKLERSHYIDGRLVDVSGARGDFVDYG